MAKKQTPRRRTRRYNLLHRPVIARPIKKRNIVIVLSDTKIEIRGIPVERIPENMQSLLIQGMQAAVSSQILDPVLAEEMMASVIITTIDRRKKKV